MSAFSSSMQRNQSCTEMERPKSPDLKAETSCSGSYIRRFVKQLSSSCPREVTDLNSSDAPLISGDPHPGDSPFKTNGREPAPPPLTPIPTQRPKKQVRRRLNATRPYKERLLNMAQARREIVTALKFHRNRAAMKQRPPPPQEAVTICNRRPPLLSPFSYASSSWTHPSFTTLLPLSGHNIATNFTFPNQPLGLNLNFQGFFDVETPLFRSKSCSMPLAIPQPSSSSSSSSTTPSSSYQSHLSPTVMACATADAPASPADPIPSDPKLHPVMGDEEMEEIRSMSEKHDMEWNDALNSASTAWWSKLLEAMEADDSGENREEGDTYQMFSEAMMDTLPGWAVDYCRRNHLSECPMDDDGQQQDAALPWEW